MMSSGGKIVYCGEWVRARPFFNKRFAASGHCQICNRMSCATGWHSIKTGRSGATAVSMLRPFIGNNRARRQITGWQSAGGGMKRVRETEETSARPVPKVIYPGELLITVVVLLIVAALVWWGF